MFLGKSSSILNYSTNIDTSIFDHFGSFAAGSIGLIWSLAGVFLLIDSLKEQKRATDANIEQIKVQQFESTFFQLINLHFETTHSMKIEMVDSEYGEKLKDDEGNAIVKIGIAFFEEFASILKREFDKNYPIETKITNEEFVNSLTQVCEEQFFLYSAVLEHYYGNLRIILQFVEEFVIREETPVLSLPKMAITNRKEKYTQILLSQLSNYELLILAYFIITRKEDVLFNLVEDRKLLKRLPKIIAMEKRKEEKWEPIVIRPELLILNFRHLN